MTIYAVIRKSDQAEVYRYAAEAPVEWAGFEFEAHDHTAQPEVEAPVEPPLPRPWITKFAFRSRFHQAEKIAIEIASLDDPAAPMQQRSMAAALRANQADVAVAQFVDLNRPDTRSGVIALEQFGLLAAGRALEILDAAPAADEVWNG